MSENVVALSGIPERDKQKALEAALGQIERAFGKGSVMRLGQHEAAADIAIASVVEYLKANDLHVLLVGFDDQMSEIYRTSLRHN